MSSTFTPVGRFLSGKLGVLTDRARGSYFCELCGASAITQLKVWAKVLVKNAEQARSESVPCSRAARLRPEPEKESEPAQKLVGVETFRVWRLYLAASGYSFERGSDGVFQSLLVRLSDETVRRHRSRGESGRCRDWVDETPADREDPTVLNQK